MQFAQRGLGGAEIGKVAGRLCDMQRDAADEAAHQLLIAGVEQRRRDAGGRGFERAFLAVEQMPRQRPRPPRHRVDPAQHGIDFAFVGQEFAAFDRAEHVALEHDVARPAAGKVVHAAGF
jgi:hypothetical protein